MTTEGTPAPEGADAGGEQAPDMTVWNDTTRDAILAKYGNDPNSLAKGYFNSQQAFNKAGEESKAISSERADFVQERQGWAAEKQTFEQTIETSKESTVTAAEFTNDVFKRVQMDLVESGEVSDDLKADLDAAGIKGLEQEAYLENVKGLTEQKFVAAQGHAPQGTDVKELLKFMNSDAVETDAGKSVFTETEHNYIREAALRGDYATAIPIVEAKYLEWMAANDPKKDIPKGVVEKIAQQKSAKTFSSKPGSGDAFATLKEYEEARRSNDYVRNPDFKVEVDRKFANSDIDSFNDQRMERMYGPNWRAGQPTHSD